MILTPDQRLRVFVSSTLGELAAERAAVKDAVERLRLAPIMFELGARSHPPRALYRSYLEQSHVFLALYADRYGWVAPGEQLSGLEDEYRLSGERPKLVYVREPAPERDPRLAVLLEEIRADPGATVRTWSSLAQLVEQVTDDLARLLAAALAPSTGTVSQAVRAAPGDTAAVTALPVPPTSLVGRDAEVAAVKALVCRDDVRMVTVTGMGGIGKSRLALEVARQVQGRFPGGVVYVPFADVPEHAMMVGSIATRLGVRLDTVREPADVVAEALADRGEVLLLLDNAEHVRGSGDELGVLVNSCPGLTMLVTSRSRMRLVAEHDYPLTPLAAGDTRAAGFGATDPPADPQMRSAAVQLFLERARSARPDRDLAADPVELRAVAELCRMLDGLPLAIEIAAARTRLLLPSALRERVERRLDLPAARLIDLPARQRTLRATLDWSHSLLPPAAQRLFAQLSTFSGGASLAAVEDVVEVEGDLLDLLATLADHSLLSVDATVIDAPRFTMLEVVREYAREQLAATGDAPRIDRSHRAWVRRLAEQARPALSGRGHAEWLERLELESANIRIAGTRAHADGDPETLAHVGFCLWLWLWARHHSREAQLWIARALDHPAQLTPLTHARLLWLLSAAALERGDNDAAFARLAEARTRFAPLHDEEGELLCDFLGASLAPLRGELEAAIETFARVEPLLAARGDVYVASVCASTAGMLLAQLGRFAEAEAVLDRALSHADGIDNAGLRAVAYIGRGFSQLGRGGFDQAARDLVAGATWAHRCRSPESLSFAVDGLAAVHLARGEAGESAAALLGAAQGLRERVGIVPWPGLRPVMAAIADGVRAAVPAEVFDPAFARGRHLDLDAILDLARLTPLGDVLAVPAGAPGPP